MRSVILILSVVMIGIAGKTQQDPMFAQYMSNALTINPAYAGSHNNLYASLLSRHQWLGFDGAPVTQAISMHTPVNFFNSAVGFTYVYDRLGPASQNIIYLDYAYKLQITDKSVVSVGFRGGFSSYGLSLNSATTNENEVNLAASESDYHLFPNAGIGLYFEKPMWYVGFSMPRLMRNKIELSDSDSEKSRLEIHYFLTSGCVWPLNDELKLKPSAMVKVVYGAPVSVDFSANLIIRDKIWAGAFYCIEQLVGAMVRYEFTNNIKLGYAFDVALNPMRNYSKGSHEVFVAYSFRFKKDNIESPRYF